MNTTATTAPAEYAAHRDLVGIPTPDLRLGDIVSNYGVRLEIVAGPRVYGESVYGDSYVWDALILNADEVEAEADSSGALLVRWARGDAARRGDDQLLYSIQGNDLARWSVETGEWLAVCEQCHRKVTERTEPAALAARALHKRYSCPKA